MIIGVGTPFLEGLQQLFFVFFHIMSLLLFNNLYHRLVIIPLIRRLYSSKLYLQIFCLYRTQQPMQGIISNVLYVATQMSFMKE